MVRLQTLLLHENARDMIWLRVSFRLVSFNLNVPASLKGLDEGAKKVATEIVTLKLSHFYFFREYKITTNEVGYYLTDGGKLS